jgi:hypothetical protein
MSGEPIDSMALDVSNGRIRVALEAQSAIFTTERGMTELKGAAAGIKESIAKQIEAILSKVKGESFPIPTAGDHKSRLDDSVAMIKDVKEDDLGRASNELGLAINLIKEILTTIPPREPTDKIRSALLDAVNRLGALGITV